jgi:hypothetical protein
MGYEAGDDERITDRTSHSREFGDRDETRRNSMPRELVRTGRRPTVPRRCDQFPASVTSWEHCTGAFGGTSAARSRARPRHAAEL